MRISFAGGGTDVSPFYEEYGGSVLNTAISKYAYVAFEPKENGITIKSIDYLLHYNKKDELINDEKKDILKAALASHLHTAGAEISFFMDVLPRAGLGSSAAAFVALLASINRVESLNMTRKKIAEEAWRLEREELKNIGGKQDQYASAFGGINYMDFSASGVDINPLRIDTNTILELESRVIVFYYKPREASGNILEKQISNVQEKKKETIDALLRSKEIAKEMKKRLLDGDINTMGALLDEAWKEKKKFSSAISSEDINHIYNMLREKGALGTKISGAGGGGYMFTFCEEGKAIDVYHYLFKAGYSPAFLNIDKKGVTTWV